MDPDPNQIGRIIIVKNKGTVFTEHYGILDGRDGVIHVNKKEGKITLDPLDRVIRKAKRVTYLDDDFDTRWLNYVRARELIGSPHVYRFITDNCETWINKVTKGQAFSSQVDSFSKTAATAVLLGSFFLAITGSLPKK